MNWVYGAVLGFVCVFVAVAFGAGLWSILIGLACLFIFGRMFRKMKV